MSGERVSLKRIEKVPSGHNFQEIGHGRLECKDCGAELEVQYKRTIYTPGDGSCE